VTLAVSLSSSGAERCISSEEQAAVSATSALVVKSVALRISPETMRRGFYGCALLEFTIDGSGHAREIHVLSSVPGAAFGRSAIAAVELYTFRPDRGTGRHKLLLEQNYLFK